MRGWRLAAGSIWILIGSLALASTGCHRVELPASGAVLYSSPQTNPIVVSEDGKFLLIANTTSHTVSVYDTRRLVRRGKLRPHLAHLADIHVGHDPVAIAQRPGSRQFWVANHISGTISVIDLHRMDVVDTIQERDANGAPTTAAPVSIAFSSPTRAFVTLDDRNEVLVVDTAADGSDAQISSRLAIPAQAPRALDVANGKVFVASFESENQTEFPSCDPFDPRLPVNGGVGIDESDSWDEGCEFATQLIGTLSINTLTDIDLAFDTIGNFAAVNPNIRGRIVRDADRPDRDLFVYDAASLALEQVVEHVGTLLYGVEATHGGRVYVTHTDARNALEGLAALDNRMFDNRLAYLDCNGACGPVTTLDLDANPFGVPVPTPYGIRSSGDSSTLVVSVAGSDGISGLAADPGVDIPGLITLDADGNVLGAVQTGAIPQGVALKSDESGAPRTAYVLNTVDSSVSVVDVRDPSNLEVIGTFEVGDDPTPPDVRQGRTMFMSARASSKGTFSCESCHPNGNIDQILWAINTVEAPNDVPECDPFSEDCPEPRTTMPIRGLRDSLPLHWVGNLADPFPDLEGQLFQPESNGQDCDLAVDGEVGCVRDLSNASLSGVMCDQNPFCAIGPSGMPGALTNEERDSLAAFMLAVSFPQSPKRASNDSLTPTALQGVQDFFTDEDGLGIGTPGGIGQAVGFAPITCADNSGGCHALPLTASTNSLTVGGFDAPSMRGLWDRTILFSNGNLSSEEWMRMAQECADGEPPVGHTGISFGGTPILPPFDANFLTGDPCAISSPLAGGGFNLDPFLGVPSGEAIYDAAVGMTERGQFMGSFEAIFHLAYGVRGASMWEYLSEMSVGLPGLAGRQLSLTPENFDDPDLVAEMELVEQYADEGRIAAVARNRFWGEYRYQDGFWKSARGARPLHGTDFRAQVARFGAVYTITADLPANVSIGGEDRQPLLDIDPDARLEEMTAKIDEGVIQLLAIPRPGPIGGETLRLGAHYVDPDARVIVDGALCAACTHVAVVAPLSGGPGIDLVLNVALTPGAHVLQVQNPNGWMSNEMPLQVEE